MIHLLAAMLMPYLDALNVLTYHTVRAGAAAMTGFGLCLVFGPRIIALLRQLKIGQFIKKEHVADLHKLHQGKAGTPTMGGVMIILSTALAMLLWGNLSNRLLWVSLAVLLLLGAVGFADDYIKLKRKHNDGLSARAKLAGQIAAGLFLGLYLVENPITVSASYVYPRDVISWEKMTERFAACETRKEVSAVQRLWEGFAPEMRVYLAQETVAGRNTPENQGAWLRGLNANLNRSDLYVAELWPKAALNGELSELLRQGAGSMNERTRVRLNRLLLEDALPGIVANSQPNLHTKLGVPGFKDLFIALPPIVYVLFVVVLIVSISNAVNLTDGLDGLAAGASITSILAYAGIAYVVSRADWSRYLYLTYVPEASELFVFGGALLGAGLGFLWFNGHPAEVFMGDTGSLALGGALGTLAVLTKQELLLPIVAGLFVLEACSVVIQVASFKLTGKRVFRMAPLHHHFELLGWTETKVTLRFWIIALLFALLSLGTLKLR